MTEPRQYIEGLIVAMHSHAFLLVSMRLLTILAVLKTWSVPHAAWLACFIHQDS